MKLEKYTLALLVIQLLSVPVGFAAESLNVDRLTTMRTAPIKGSGDYVVGTAGLRHGQSLEAENVMQTPSNLPPENVFNPKNSLRSIFGPDSLIKLANDTKVTVESDNHIDFHSGEMLVWAIGETRIKCLSGVITIAPQTVALFQGNDSAVSVSNVYECNGKSTVLETVDGQEIYVSAGNSLAFANNDDNLKSLLCAQQFGRRNIRTWRGADDKDYLRSEISLVSLLHESKLLHELTKRPTKSEQVIVERIMKMAACLHVATSHHGPYTSVKL
jgi:hypothetical protein